VVTDATNLAWARSNPTEPWARREQGGWIIGNDQTGAVRSVAVPPGQRAVLPDNPLPTLQPGERVLAHYHTHPTPPEQPIGTRPDGSPINLAPAPGAGDMAFAQHTGVPEIVRSREHMWVYDPATGGTTQYSVPPEAPPWHG
jgi:hypothetical protein